MVGAISSDLPGAICSGQVGAISSDQMGAVCAESPQVKELSRVIKFCKFIRNVENLALHFFV